MKIAVTYENGMIFQHFGHTNYFKLYEAENGVITQETVVGTQGKGHGELARFLKEHQVDVLICGGIGGGARMALAEANIQLYGGVAGNANAAVQAFLTGELEYDPDVKCDHHDHAAGHVCGHDHGHCHCHES